MIALAAAAMFACTAIAVHDGDGPIWCEDGTKVRLWGIQAPELDGGCASKFCVPGDGYVARDHLVGILEGKPRKPPRSNPARLLHPVTIQCEPKGKTYGRIAARCWLGDIDLSCAQIRAAHAVEWERYSRGYYRGCAR